MKRPPASDLDQPSSQTSPDLGLHLSYVALVTGSRRKQGSTQLVIETVLVESSTPRSLAAVEIISRETGETKASRHNGAQVHDVLDPGLAVRSHRSPEMCQTESFQSHTCAHRWMTIVKPCQPGTGFSSAHYHKYTPTRKGSLAVRYVAAAANSCPSCDKKGDYDGNLTRMVLDQPSQTGGLGNGYTMTDGRGNVLPWGQGNGVPVPMQRSTCPARMGPRPAASVNCCVVM